MQVKITNKIINFFNDYKNIFCVLITGIIFAIWVGCTLFAPEMNIFHSDEAWYYVIAKDLNFIEIIKLMKYEGHNFLYYILMKPFTHDLSMFPSVIKYFGWSFSCAAVIVFLLFSKINMLMKILITFSSPFLVVFPTVGKPIGLGVLLLFLLAILYKNRLKYPIIYAFIIFLTANTHVLVAFGAITLSFIFLYDLIKDRDNQSSVFLYCSIFIIFFTYLSLLIQWFPVKMPHFVIYYDKKDCLLSLFFPNNNPITKTFLWIMYIPVGILVFTLNAITIKSKRWLFFIVSTYGLLTIFFIFVYPLIPPYGFLYYVYLIITYMILIENNEDFKNKKYAFVSLSLYLMIFSLILFPFERECAVSRLGFKEEYSREISDISKTIPAGSTVYLAYAQELMPFLVANYNVKSPLGYKIPSFRAYSGLYQDRIPNPSEIKTVKGEKTYYIHWKKEYDNEEDNKYKKYKMGYRNFYEIIDITKK